MSVSLHLPSCHSHASQVSTHTCYCLPWTWSWHEATKEDMELWRKAGGSSGSVEQSGRQGKAVKDMSAAQVSLHGKEVRIDVTRPGSLYVSQALSLHFAMIWPLYLPMSSMTSELDTSHHFSIFTYLHTRAQGHKITFAPSPRRPCLTSALPHCVQLWNKACWLVIGLGSSSHEVTWIRFVPHVKVPLQPLQRQAASIFLITAWSFLWIAKSLW